VILLARCRRGAEPHRRAPRWLRPPIPDPTTRIVETLHRDVLQQIIVRPAAGRLLGMFGCAGDLVWAVRARAVLVFDGLESGRILRLARMPVGSGMGGRVAGAGGRSLAREAAAA